MPWTVRNHDDFDIEFDALPVEVQDELLAMTALLKVYGPGLGRPHADTLAGSRHANMKALRFKAGDGCGGWRSRSIRSARRSCWWPVTRRAWPRSGSTRG